MQRMIFLFNLTSGIIFKKKAVQICTAFFKLYRNIICREIKRITALVRVNVIFHSIISILICRETLLTHTDILLKLELLEKQVVQNSDGIRTLFEALKQLLNPPQEPRKRIGFKPND
jgi:hypothetical protein